VTRSQCKEARRLLKWSPVRLGSESDTGSHVVAKFEATGHAPPRKAGGQSSEARLNAIRAALESAGIEFIAEDEGGLGVRLKSG
jgi:hypothetical protein